MKAFMDWAHKEDKVKVLYNGKVYKSTKKLPKGTSIYVENLPVHLSGRELKRGNKVFRCHTTLAAEIRKRRGLEKGDTIDVHLIKEIYEANPDKFDEWKGTNIFTIMAEQFWAMQTQRIQTNNRIFALGNQPTDFLDEFSGSQEEWEYSFVKEMERLLKDCPIWTKYLQYIKGVGPVMGGCVIGLIERKGIKNFESPSSLLHYFGLVPDNKKPVYIVDEDTQESITFYRAMRLESGTSAGYVPHAKAFFLGRLVNQLKRVSPDNPYFHEWYYRHQVYEPYKARKSSETFPPGRLYQQYLNKNGRSTYKKEDTKRYGGHVEMMAHRKMAQQFIIDMWVVWRQLERLSTKSIWIDGKNGHKQIPPPYIPKELLPFNPNREARGPQLFIP